MTAPITEAMRSHTLEVLQRLRKRLKAARDLDIGTNDHALGIRAGYGGAVEALANEIEYLESTNPVLIRTEHLEEAVAGVNKLKGEK